MNVTIKTRKSKMNGTVVLPAIVVEKVVYEHLNKAKTSITFGFWHVCYEVELIRPMKSKTVKA